MAMVNWWMTGRRSGKDWSSWTSTYIQGNVENNKFMDLCNGKPWSRNAPINIAMTMVLMMANWQTIGEE